VLLTGGDDIEPNLYSHRMPQSLRATVSITPDGGARDLREILLLDEVFRQRKPLLAICRGHQLLNVALGGTLIADIPSQRPGSLDHRRTDKRNQTVHEVRLTPDSLLAKITTTQTLRVNSTHHQAVGQVAPALQVCGRAPDGVVEALELKPGVAALPFLVSVQFHPERLGDRYPAHATIFTAFTRACALSRNTIYEG
jgi:putative glutamine amidotransferase